MASPNNAIPNNESPDNESPPNEGRNFDHMYAHIWVHYDGEWGTDDEFYYGGKHELVKCKWDQINFDWLEEKVNSLGPNRPPNTMMQFTYYDNGWKCAWNDEYLREYLWGTPVGEQSHIVVDFPPAEKSPTSSTSIEEESLDDIANNPYYGRL